MTTVEIILFVIVFIWLFSLSLRPDIDESNIEDVIDMDILADNVRDRIHVAMISESECGHLVLLRESNHLVYFRQSIKEGVVRVRMEMYELG